MVNIDKIKTLAKEKGVSITFLCQSIGQGAYYFNDVKRRNGSIPDDRLEKIAKILGTTVEYLTDKTDQKEKPVEIPTDKMELNAILLKMTDEQIERLKQLAKDMLGEQ